MEVSFEVAKDGTRVPAVQGKALESLSNPLRDAERWKEREKDKLTNFDHVIVLGLGSGEYIRSLANEFPAKRIFVFECIERDDIDELNLPENVSLAICDSLDQVMENDLSGEILRAPFRVLRHPGSYRFFSGFYDSLTEFLTGRSQAGLKWNLQHRPCQAKFFRHWDKFVNSEMFSGRAVTVVDVNRFANTHVSDSGYERSIWSTLRELVK